MKFKIGDKVRVVKPWGGNNSAVGKIGIITSIENGAYLFY